MKCMMKRRENHCHFLARRKQNKSLGNRILNYKLCLWEIHVALCNGQGHTTSENLGINV